MAPYFSLPLSDQFLDVGGTVDLRCEAIGKPTPSYKWYRDCIDILTVSEPRYTVSAAGNKLTITNLKMEDSHTFQCSAINQFGTLFTTANIRVLGISLLIREFRIAITLTWELFLVCYFLIITNFYRLLPGGIVIFGFGLPIFWVVLRTPLFSGSVHYQ